MTLRRPRLPTAALSREARDTLFLLGVLGWTLLPQLTHVPLWCAFFAAGALLWRGWIALRGRPLPGRRWLLLALAVAALGTAWSHHSLLGKEAGITLLVLLAALKTLELRARRDAVVVFFLGFVLVLAAFLRSQSLAVALAMGLSVVGLLMALALAHMPGGRPGLRSVLGLTLRNAALGTPVIVLLFLFFPRLPPLWGMPAAGIGQTGLSDELQLGQVAELASDERLAMRVEFPDGSVPAPEQLYFRGPVLRRYDGQRWRADDGGLGPAPLPGSEPWAAPGPTGPTGPPGPPGAMPLRLELGQPLSYIATLEPSRLTSLPLLEFTASAPQVQGLDAPLALRDDLHWQTRQPRTERLRLRGQAFLSLRHLETDAPGRDLRVKDDERSLPPGVHPRTRAWAAALRDQPALASASPERFAELASEAVLAHIRSAGFVYTLAPGLGGEADPLDDFWLDQREGFCEHYAVAYVVVMRALGVPARIVTGYQGGRLNPIDGLLEVRQSDAHAWAEVWLPGAGWSRVDPTAAVAPDRIRLGQRLQAAPGLIAGTLAQVDPALLERLRQLWSAADHRWNDWVLHYGRQRQQDLLRQIGWESPDLYSAARTLLTALAVLGLAGATWAAWDGWRSRRRDPWLRLLTATQAELARRGLTDAPRLPARSLADAVLTHWGPAGAPLATALRQLDQRRYGPAPPSTTGPRPHPHTWSEALQLRRSLRQLPHRPPALKEPFARAEARASGHRAESP